MPWYGTLALIYGILCVFIGLLKPPFIYNMGKIKAMEKMMGKTGARIFILVWGALFIAIAFLVN